MQERKADGFSSESIIEQREKEPPRRLETVIVLIRHGEAEEEAPNLPKDQANLARRLTMRGIQESMETGQKLKEALNLKEEDIIFFRSSPAARARQTAEIARAMLLSEGHQYQISGKPEEERLYFNKVSDMAYGYGIKRKGTAKGLGEEWVRNPEIFQKDLEAAGVEKDVLSVIEERKNTFQNFLAIFERASHLLRKRWEHYEKEKGSTEKPPRLIILLGSHGAIVSESWLFEVVKDYEQKKNEKVPFQLEKGEYFTITIPSNPEIPPILKIHGKEIPISKEFLKKVRTKNGEESTQE